ncbi:MAG: ATP-binding protein [Bryobacterales bacterium]|nr:ATP-binding protein [Bryobacterales bacterium]MDE0626633.1 ATP-binding protein [Bryobacterales bacterium]
MTARILFKLGLVTMLPILVTAVAVLVLVTIFTIVNLENGLEKSLSEKARLVETTLQGRSADQFQSAAQDLARRAQARVTVIDSDGRVLADSEANPSLMENHADRPEFVNALQGETAVSRRFSSTIGADFLYVAIPMEDGGAIRLALPLEEVEALAQASRNRVTLVILLIVVPLILVTAWSARRISTQLSDIVSLSNEIAEGNFEIEHSMPKRGDLGELNDLRRSLQTTAAKLRSTFNALQEERSRFAAAVNGIGAGILVVDSKRRVVLFNPAIKRMFPGEDLNNGASLKSWRNKRVPEIFNFTIKRRQPYSTELTMHEPTERSWRVSCAPILSKKGNIRAAAAVFHDVTELERVDRMRRDFVINVSHELRTPLASITGYAETLMDGAIDDTRNNRRFVRILWQNARRLTQLTSDLMTLSQIEVKAREFEFRMHSVSKLLRIATEGIRPVAEGKKLTLSVRPVDSGITLQCDAGALQQILANLLDNAAKYTPEHGRISVGVQEREGKLDFYVSDTGIGIAKEHIPRLFERFYRVDKARSRELGGTGLGLAIVKHLVQAHNGAVWVESELGVGTTFWFALPTEQPIPRAMQAIPALGPELPLQ